MIISSLSVRFSLERFLIECHKTKTKVIQLPIKTKINITISHWKVKVSTGKRPQGRENAPSDEVPIGFSFASDWLRGWREFSRPITERSKSKPIQFRITFDTQLKIALIQTTLFIVSGWFYVSQNSLISARGEKSTKNSIHYLLARLLAL